jgi:hypothetical protein
MFTEPPSVDGTAGPQIEPPEEPADAPPADDAVVCAALDDELGASPGSCRAAFGSPDAGALIDDDEPDKAVVPVGDPAALEFVESPVPDSLVAEPVPAAPAANPDAAGVLVATEFVPLSKLVVLPGVAPDVPVIATPDVVLCMFVGAAVWAWSAVAPSRTSVTASAAVGHRGGAARPSRPMPCSEFSNMGARLRFICLSCSLMLAILPRPSGGPLNTTNTGVGASVPHSGGRSFQSGSIV